MPASARRLSFSALSAMKTERVLPFRFLAAARYAPQWEEALEQAMYRAIAGRERFAGRTVLLVDISGSMDAPLARRSEMLRMDAACGLAVLLREVCERSRGLQLLRQAGAGAVASRLCFARCDCSQPAARRNEARSCSRAACARSYDRIIVITDEQSHDRVPAPNAAVT